MSLEHCGWSKPSLLHWLGLVGQGTARRSLISERSFRVVPLGTLGMLPPRSVPLLQVIEGSIFILQAALQVMSDVMRRELVHVGIDVITLELGESLEGASGYTY
jgi:hypothetical protein